METTVVGIRAGEWLTIAAALLGPILAIQAQKWLERSQARRAMKDGIFRTLMATRAALLAPEHVQALNMIDIAFYGRRIFGRQLQTGAERKVCTARRSYFDVLNNAPEDVQSDSQYRTWESLRSDRFFALLEQIAVAQNFEFDPTELRRAVYSPVKHGAIEGEQEAIRSGLAKLFKGETALPMRVVNFPEPPQE